MYESCPFRGIWWMYKYEVRRIDKANLCSACKDAALLQSDADAQFAECEAAASLKQITVQYANALFSTCTLEAIYHCQSPAKESFVHPFIWGRNVPVETGWA